MALNFTDDQIKELSSKILTGPLIVEDANKQVADAELQKQDFLDADGRNEVFTDNMINIIDQFHKELKLLDGTVRTLYDESKIDLGAQLIISEHFPTNWPFFFPKVLESNKGLPTSVTVDEIEPEAIDELQKYIDLLVNGFSDGAVSEPSDGAVSGGQIPYDVDPNFGIGDRIVLLSGGGTTGASFGVVTGTATITYPPPSMGPTPPDTFVVQYDSEFSAGSLPTGTVVSNYHPGFNNAQREAPTSNLYQTYLQQQIDADVDNWKSNFLQLVLNTLTANDSTDDKSEIDSEKDEINNALSIVIAWESQPNTGTGTGRFGDTQLSPLTNEALDRETRIPNRVVEINTSLGTLDQDLGGKGEFSGSGRYFNYFESLNARLHQSTGTRKNFYQMDNAISYVEQTRDNTIAEVARTQGILQIKLLKSDPVGSDIIEMVDVSDLQVGESVKFMDNEKPVLNYTIVGIIPNERKLQLDGQLPTNYKLTQQARIVKVL